MNLAIDIGNTRVKVAVFNDEKLLHTQAYEKFEEKDVKFLFKRFSIQHSILSAVSSYEDSVSAFLATNSKVVILDTKTPLPIKIFYKTPLTLGKDRIAAVAGAVALFPKENVLVLDAGTAITHEFINAEGEYLGGGISPGIRLRFKALNAYTSHLPLIEPENIDYLTGRSTKESILSGVMNGIRFEIEGIIKEYSEKYSELKVLMTGGDAPAFETTLKSKIFAVPNLVLTGLNKILQHNVSLR
ncbi:MAG: type III pantothenate kinase [Chitinophagales bacterium]|nr:type III pantothenate kinase [Chitinophagales bacterium]